MDVRTALQEQYHSALAMLRQCVERCPEDLWQAGQHPRQYWRIALHAAFFTQFGMGQTYKSFLAWSGANSDSAVMWERPEYVEPYELPEDVRPYTREQVLEYVAFVDSLVDPIVGALDLETDDSGFPWEGNTSKISQQLKNLRHVQGHAGQLSELLMARGIDIDWVG